MLLDAEAIILPKPCGVAVVALRSELLTGEKLILLIDLESL